MRSKFQLNEGEVKRILNLHKSAIIKETQIIPIDRKLLMEKSYSVTLKKRSGWNAGGLQAKDVITKVKEINSNTDLVELEVTFKSEGKINVSFQCTQPDIMVIAGGDGQMDGSEFRVDEKFKNLIKWYCKGKPSGEKSGTSSDQTNTYELKYDRKFTSKKNPNKSITLKAGTILTFKPEKSGATFKFGNKFGWFNCSTTNISFGGKESRRIYTANNEDFTKTMQGVCKKMGVTITSSKSETITTDGNNPVTNDGNNTVTNDGVNTNTNDGLNIGTTLDKIETILNTSGSTQLINRSLTGTCQTAEFRAKNCNDQSLKMQMIINDFCDPTTLNDAIQNFSKGFVGVKGAYSLLEDGIFGDASKAAFTACQTDILKKGTSGSSGSQGSSGTSGSSLGQTGAEDLRLTDAEYVKLTS